MAAGGGGAISEGNSVQLKQLEMQNERLKEALIKYGASHVVIGQNIFFQSFAVRMGKGCCAFVSPIICIYHFKI